MTLGRVIIRRSALSCFGRIVSPSRTYERLGIQSTYFENTSRPIHPPFTEASVNGRRRERGGAESPRFVALAEWFHRRNASRWDLSSIVKASFLCPAAACCNSWTAACQIMTTTVKLPSKKETYAAGNVRREIRNCVRKSENLKLPRDILRTSGSFERNIGYNTWNPEIIVTNIFYTHTFNHLIVFPKNHCYIIEYIYLHHTKDIHTQS